MKMIRTECPVCQRNNSDNTLLFERNFEMACEIVPFKAYQVFRCKKCGMYYAGNIEEAMPLNEYYRTMSKYEQEEAGTTWATDIYKNDVEFIQTNGVKQSAKILEIGCGNGELLRELQSAGYTNLYGLELSKKNCDLIRTRYHIKTFQGGIGDSLPELHQYRFDLLILNCVFEHLLCPRDCMAECRALLSEDGKIMICSPNVERFPEYKDLYQQFSVEHVNYFDDVSICSLGALCGLSTDSCEWVHDKGRGECSRWMLMQGTEKEPDAVENAAAMDFYLRQCSLQAEKIRERKHELVEDGEQIYVWGVGTITSTLFQMGLLNSSMIAAIFDSNPNYQGHAAYGHIVQSPKTLADLKKRPILVASQIAFDSICKQMMEMGLKNPVINVFE